MKIVFLSMAGVPGEPWATRVEDWVRRLRAAGFDVIIGPLVAPLPFEPWAGRFDAWVRRRRADGLDISIVGRAQDIRPAADLERSGVVLAPVGGFSHAAHDEWARIAAGVYAELFPERRPPTPILFWPAESPAAAQAIASYTFTGFIARGWGLLLPAEFEAAVGRAIELIGTLPGPAPAPRT